MVSGSVEPVKNEPVGLIRVSELGDWVYCNLPVANMIFTNGSSQRRSDAAPYWSHVSIAALIRGETPELSRRIAGQVPSDRQPLQIWVQNWVQLAANIPHNGPIFRIESIVNKG